MAFTLNELVVQVFPADYITHGTDESERAKALGIMRRGNSNPSIVVL